MTIRVTSANEAIDAVGGNGPFAEWWGASDKTVSAWRRRGFPSKTYEPMRDRLRSEKKIDVPPTAWGMAERVSA